MKTEAHNVTQLLINWREGDEDARARLLPLVYEEVRRLAQTYLQRERSEHTPDAALVREAYLRLVDDKETTSKDRANFYGIAARIVRTILVDHARAHSAGDQKLPFDEADDLPSDGTIDLVALDGALETFAQTYPRKSEVVELKFFGGLETQEISEMLQVSEKTVLRDWNFAKLWLCRALSNAA
jgi:RNA polymerase sigma factor (TIGR02999 family)